MITSKVLPRIRNICVSLTSFWWFSRGVEDPRFVNSMLIQSRDSPGVENPRFVNSMLWSTFKPDDGGQGKGIQDPEYGELECCRRKLGFRTQPKFRRTIRPLCPDSSRKFRPVSGSAIASEAGNPPTFLEMRPTRILATGHFNHHSRSNQIRPDGGWQGKGLGTERSRRSRVRRVPEGEADGVKERHEVRRDIASTSSSRRYDMWESGRSDINSSHQIYVYVFDGSLLQESTIRTLGDGRGEGEGTKE